MDYNLFRKSVTGKNGKQSKRWYYWFYDESGRQIKKSCMNCSTKAEAELYISNLPPLKNALSKITIKQIAEFMYICYFT